MSEFNNYETDSAQGGYLVVYVNGEKFTPEVRTYWTWDEGEQYSLVNNHPETVRLAEYFGVEIERHASILIIVEEEEKRGFFGGRRMEKVYTFECNGFQKKFQSDLIYLEK